MPSIGNGKHCPVLARLDAAAELSFTQFQWQDRARAMFSQAFKELLSAFQEFRVKYLIVRGYAVAIHAQPRATKDLDLFIQPDAENAKAVYAALAKFGAPLLISAGRFHRPGVLLPLGYRASDDRDSDPYLGVEFDPAWERRTEEVINESKGLEVFVFPEADFITNKLAAARPQDIADATAVRRASELRLNPPAPGE